MIKAVLTNGGKQVLLIGLAAENMARLPVDKPIVFNAAELGLPAQPIVIVGGADEDAILTYVKAAGGHLAELATTDPDADQPRPDRPGPSDYAAAEAALAALPRDAQYAPADVVHVVLNAAYAARANVWAAGRSYTCPRCLMTSPNANDVANGYCGHCHAFTGTPRGPNPPPPGRG